VTTLYLHVGCPKSGTTYLQRILDHNRERLADAGVLVVGERHVDRVQAALQVREDARWRKLPQARQDMWGELVTQIRSWTGDAAILSYELFSAATAEQAARALSDLAGIDVHVVITARDLARSVPSAWQERLKFGLKARLEDWTPPPAERAGSEWGWRTTDPSSVAERWGASLAPDHVHVVTAPRARDRRDPHELWHRFAAACGISALDVDLALPRSNESLGAVEAELLRRVNTHLRAPLDQSREQARWLRDVLANSLLAARRGEQLGMTDAQFAEAADRAVASVAALQQAGYAVVGDLADLTATRAEGRLPGEVTDAELVDAAAEVIVELLLLLREAESRVAEAAPEPVARRDVAGRVAQQLTRPYVKKRDDALVRRIAELEAKVQADRVLHQRVAALQDVISQLLVPRGRQDTAITFDALERYRQESL
jgi:hypothetical protein